MNTIYLDRAEIEEKIKAGNTYEGHWVLAVDPDGSAHRIYWAQERRQWNPWPDGWLTTPLPSVYPEGSGRDTEDAQTALEAALSPKELADATRRHDEDEATWVELAEELLGDQWTGLIADYARDLADEWLWALNGAPSSLDIYWEGGNESPARFEWAPALESWLTPAEAEKLTGISESTWRGRCWRGDVPGATKKGRDWLMPRAWLRAQGYKV